MEQGLFTLSVAVYLSLALPELSVEQAVPGSDLFFGRGKVVILQPDTSFNITQLKAFQVYIKNLNPVYVQIWRRNSETSYSLAWQRRLAQLPIFGRNLVNLDEKDVLMVSPDHRLGIYNERDPGPIPYLVTEEGTAVLSEQAFSTSPAINDTYTFTSLNFPYTFGIQLCNYTDCLPSEPTTTSPATTTTTTSSTTISNKLPTVLTAPVPGGTEHPLMSGTFLVVLLVWLIVITFIVITVIIVIIYLNARNSGAITRAAEDKGSEAGGDGEWYIVVQDSAQAQKVMSS